ncbi:hypothetical protein M422DRAFT_250208 [Sphaerobolus stellatus SS14]|uniref:Uncharacterized protein n=1 Tax=Sphaerobolus stellatus (strain SS14) TaxID=990650 RepID=A0A0C9UTJ2_SPHS4|nr:hypothetical protein M422DRAFT_250208 [Sphaerobolus stellatus SS14]
MIKWMEFHPSDWLDWVEQYEKGGDPELIDNILLGYSSVLDQRAANIPETLYRAYPDAKLILMNNTGSEEWERSLKLTVWQKSARVWNELRAKLQPELLIDDFADVLVRHNKRVEELTPASQLLVYKVEDGWEPLSEFLGVLSIPNVNNTDTFRAMLKLPALL